MPRLALAFLAIAALLAAFAAPAGASTFSNPAPISIPNSGAAAPYPSTVNVSGISPNIAGVTVTLTDLEHSLPDDVDVLLVGPTGEKTLLMSDTGGGGNLNGIDLTFDDDAAGTLPDATQIVSGTFKPTNLGAGDTFPAPAPAGPYPDPQSLSRFIGENPNGTWSLYIHDDGGGNDGDIEDGWRLAIDQAPVGVNDTPTVAEDSGANAIDVLANDNDPDGGPRRIISASSPANGAVGIASGGSGLIYTPDADYCNDPGAAPPDTITYTLFGGSTATVNVTVTCAEEPPVAVDDAATVAEDSAPTTIDVLANDTDVDAGPKAIASVSNPRNGLVELTGGTPGAQTALTYRPDRDYCNAGGVGPTDDFTYTVNGGSTATVRVTVDCADEPPPLIVPGPPAPDTTGPQVTLTLRRLALPRALRNGYSLPFTTNEPARATLELLQRNRRIARGTAQAVGGRQTVIAKFSASTRRRLRKARTLRLTVVLTVVDLAGNRTVERRAVTLRR